MAILYVDLISGNDTTGDGSAGAPYLTVNKAVSIAGSNDIRVAKTTASTTVTVSGTGITWTANSVTVTANQDITGSIAVADYIAKTTGAGNGAEETYYRVNAISYNAGTTTTTITLEQKYGGTTQTEASCLKLNPATTGSAGATAMTINEGISLSGGWNLTGTPTQDGETWFKHAGPRATAANRGIDCSTVAGISVSKMNAIECYYGIYQAAVSSADQCTMHGYAIGILTHNAVGCSATNCCASYVTGYSAFYLQSTPTITNCVGLGTIVYSYYSANTTFTNCKAISGGTGWNVAVLTYFNSCEARNMATCGILNPSTNSIVNGCTFTNNAIGIQTATAQGGIVVKSCTFTNNTSSIYFYQTHGNLVDNCTFTGGLSGTSYHINANDSYSGDLYINQCTFNTPTTYAIFRAAATGRIVVTGCTIDGASIAKAYNTTASSYVQVQYVLVGSFGKNGTIFGNTSVVQDYSIYRTSPPSLGITNVSTTTTSNLDIKVVSSYVNAGSDRTYDLYIKPSVAGSWAGSITPKWVLNGATIKTESGVIISLASGWTNKTYSCSGNLIYSGGELSLNFTPNMNAYSFYVDDFTVT